MALSQKQNQSEFCLFITTAPEEKIAQEIADCLIEDGFAACVHVLPMGKSCYVWEGRKIWDQENWLLIKSKSCYAPKIFETITARHPYDCPAFFEIPIAGGSADFLNWIERKLVSS